MEQNQKISELLLPNIDETGSLKLDRELTVSLLSWIDNAEKKLNELTLRINNVKNLVEKIK